MPLGPLGSQTPQPSIGMQFEEAEGGIAVAMATDNDKEMRPIGDCGAHGFDPLYLRQNFRKL